MSSMQIDAVLAQIRAMQSQIRSPVPNETAPAAGMAGMPAGAAQAPGAFANLIRDGLGQVNQTQQRAAHLATQFEQGVPGVELSQVMLEMQKASVSFRAVTEVRNRFVSAYQEIMNMPL
jgi:flagellar hook-basal body complex protein FliE